MAGLESQAATARIRALRRDLEATLQRGEHVKARSIRQSLMIMSIWYPEVGA
jgi:hypothetical protein